MLRIIAGKYRGRKLNQPSKEITRPTMDRVKEAIFNIIQFKISKAIVLDLFSGSGSLGIEAISRGAMKVIAIERNKEAVNILQENVKKLEINNINIIKTDVLNYVALAKGQKFDFIFMDPPFNQYQLYEQVFQAIVESKLLKKYGLLILETNNPKKINIPPGLTLQREKKYGTSTVMFLANNI